MSQCPFCKSDYIIYSKKKCIYMCEDCGETFETPLAQVKELQLFFSYSHDKNAVIVEKLKEELEKRGHHVWIDKSEIRSGDDWREEITKGILGSDKVISFMSCHSVRNPGVCLDELKIALCVRGADIRTVLLEGEGVVKPPSSLSSRQWLDMSEWQSKMNEGEERWNRWFDEKLEQLCDSIESEAAYAFAGEIEKLRQLLKPVLHDSRELSLVSRGFEGRKWLWDAVQKWKDRAGSNKVFCLYGVPGAGKSSFLANLMHYNADILGAVFFEWNEIDRNALKAVIRSLAFQIAAKLPDYRQQLLHILSKVKSIETCGENELFRLLLTDPLNNCIDGNRNTYIIALDALDEGLSGQRDKLVSFLEKLRELPEWIKIIVTAREEPFVKAMLSDAEQISLDSESSENNEDIEKYIHKRLGEIEWVDYNVVQKVVKQAEGSFLYAVFYCDGVLSGDISLLETDTMPKGLGRFYVQNFYRIFQKSSDYERVRPALELLNCRESIPRDIFCEVLQLDHYAYMEFRKKMGAFVQINRVKYPYTEEPQYLLKFVHKSLADWLTDAERSEGFSLDVSYGRRMLAEYALKQVRKNKYYVKKPNRYISCPQIAIDLDLDYLQTNLGRFLLDAGMLREYEEFLLEGDTPWEPYWREVGNYPAKYPMNRLFERLREGFDDIWKEISNANYKATELFAPLFSVLLDVIRTQKSAEVLFEQLKPGRLDNYFRSGASDGYISRGIPGIFNADKVDAAYYIHKCMENCKILNIVVPDSCMEAAERMKLSCMFYEGKYDDSMETVYGNYSFFFRDNVCVLDDEKISKEFNFVNVAEIRREFNTFCLGEFLKSFKQDDSVADQLVSQGADFQKAAECAIAYHEVQSKKVSESHIFEISETPKMGIRVNSTMSAANNRINYIEYLRNRYATKKRWHPCPVDCVMDLGPMFDYCKIYKFPCCGRNIVAGEPPSQYRQDGCEELEE